MKKANPEISVIIPTYNVERYIAQCIDSVSNQSLEEIEIIVVDDGSTDNTLPIVRELASRDERITLVEEPHQDAGHARNRGLDLAKGEYLSFLDADDFFEPTMLADIISRAKLTNADVVLYNADRFIDADQEFLNVPWMLSADKFPDKDTFNAKEIKPNFFRSMVGWTWDKLFKKEHILTHKIRFQEQPSFNDMFFTFSAVLVAEKITLLNSKPLVHQRKRGGGSISDKKSLAWMFLDPALTALREFLVRHNLYYYFEQDYVNYALHLFDNNLQALSDDADAYCEFEKQLRNKLYYKFGISTASPKFFYVQTEWERYRSVINKPLRQEELDRIVSDKSTENGEDFIISAPKQPLTLDDINDAISTCFDTTRSLFLETISSQHQLLIDIRNRIPNKPVFWKNPIERQIVSENWGDVMLSDDFEEKYLRLIRGMDKSSIAAITRIISRQHSYLNSDWESLDLFTRQEQEELRILQEEFYSNIIPLSDNLFAYGNYLLPVNHFEPNIFFYKYGINMIKKLDDISGRDIIDVGGYIGDSALILNELSPRRIIIFEANPHCEKIINRTLSLNKIENATVEMKALGSREGTAHLNLLGSMSTVVSRKGLEFNGATEVNVITLDDYIKNKTLDIALIKVDIEGGEPLFLEGAKNTLSKYRPTLMVSIYHNANDFFNIKPLIESWNLGYEFSVFKPTLSSVTGETLLICNPT